MKKSIVSIALFLALFSTACSSFEAPQIVENTPIQKSRKVIANDSILSFDSMEDFQAKVNYLSTLSSDVEKAQWVNENYPGFKSIQDYYWDAMCEMAEKDMVDEASYIAFKQKYDKLYFPNYMEDAGFYIPMSDLESAFLVNDNCEIVVDGEKVNLKDITNYEDLVIAGRAYYSLDAPVTLSTYTQFQLNGTSMDPVGPDYDSGWTTYDDRKVKLKAHRKFKTITLSPGFNGSESYLHLEFCFRKKTWLGWSNYKSESTIVFTANVPYSKVIGPLTFTHNSNSSHDSEFVYPIRIYSDATNWYYTFDEAPCEATINFRGVPQTLKYNWNMPGIQSTSSVSSGAFTILPRVGL